MENNQTNKNCAKQGKNAKQKTYRAKDILKRQIAEELGYRAKIDTWGWGELTSAEAGRIGGMVADYMKKNQWK